MSDTMHDDVRTTAPRIATLDALRGLALLGILLMNIVGFALPKAAYLNPAYQGMPSAGDQVAWLLSSLLVQGKFLTLFALLFGAGLEMLLPRGAIWIQTRLGWLVLFGLVHTLVLWDGDILLAYGLIGLVSWRMIRDAGSVRTLFNSGVTLYAIGLGMLLVQYGWQLAGLMALGAALMRSGWLRGRFPSTHYRRVGVALLLLGVAIQLPTSLLQWHLQWAYRWCGYLLQLPGELAAPLMMLGYVALIYAYWSRLAGWRLTRALERVGRMALSNYLLQTLICTTLFYRLGLFNQAGRALLLWVPGVWGGCLLFSWLWLRRFRQGPMEWLWRRLTSATLR